MADEHEDPTRASGAIAGEGSSRAPLLARRAELRRITRETDVTVLLNLDGRGEAAISTGIGFLDHMLDSFAIHGRFDIEMRAIGDLGVDLHHTVEDVAMVLGQAVSEALGDCSGIERFADVAVPMDESVAFTVLDCSGRGYAVLGIDFLTESVGGVPASLLVHFFEVFARSARITLHLDAHGRDEHHLAEACFKSLGRALRAAVFRGEGAPARPPSGKGVL